VIDEEEEEEMLYVFSLSFNRHSIVGQREIFQWSIKDDRGH